MDIQVTGRHLSVTSETRELVEEKITRLEKYFERITRVEVILEAFEKRNEYKAEVIVHAPRGTHLVSHATEETMTSAVDTGIHKMERQLSKFKERLKDTRAKKKTGRFLKESTGSNPHASEGDNW